MAHSGGIETTEQHDSSSDEESNIPPRSSGQPIGEEEEGRTAAQNPTRGSATLPPPPLPMAPESIIAIDVMEDETPPLPLVFSIDNDDTLLIKKNMMRCIPGSSSDGPLITQQLSDDDEMARNDNARPSLPEEVITGVEEKPPLPLALTYDDSALGTKEKLDIQKETTPMPMVDDSSHHSQQQDDDQHTSTLINPQSIPFYEVEACLVRDSEIYDSDRRRRDEEERSRQEIIYDAVLVPEEDFDDSSSRWKWHNRTILSLFGICILLIAGVAIALAIILSRPDPPPDPEIDKPTPSPTTQVPTLAPTFPPPPPLLEGISGVRSLGTFNQTGCDYCRPFVAIGNNDTAVVAPWYNHMYSPIYVTEKTEDGNSYEIEETIDVSVMRYHVVSLFDDILVVGLPGEIEQRGSVYVYNRQAPTPVAPTGSWNMTQRLAPPTSVQVDAYFGGHFDMFNGVMVIGASNDRPEEGKVGSAYVYRLQTEENGLWELEGKLAPSNSDHDGKMADFGRVVAIMQNMIAVGDQAYDYQTKQKGAVWIYKYNVLSKTWTLLQFVRDDDCDNWFGSSVAFTYDLGLLVGCGKDDDQAGAIFYYEPSSGGEYTLHQKIITSDRAAKDRIGLENSIATYSNVMLAGTGKSKNGSVYIFLRQNGVWVETDKIVSPPDEINFGRNVAMSGSNVVVSANNNAYYYELLEGPSTIRCVSARAPSSLLGDDCESNCKPHMAIDHDVAVVGDTESIRVYSNTSGSGGFKIDAYFEADAPAKSLALSNDTIIAGIPWKSQVRVFEQRDLGGSWVEALTFPHNASFDKESFGEAVAMIDGDIAVVGANAFRSGVGSAHVFRRIQSSPSSWIKEEILVPDDPYLNGFGSVVSVAKNTVAVGDPKYNNTAGAVFVYQFNETSREWTQMNQTILNSDCTGGFGYSVVLTRDNDMFIGCPGNTSETGAVYYYTQPELGGTFHLRQKLQAVDGKANDNFGGSDKLAVYHDLLVVGTDKEVNGTIHVFAMLNTSWTEVETINSPHGQRMFGYKVALSGRTVLAASTSNIFFTVLDDC